MKVSGGDLDDARQAAWDFALAIVTETCTSKPISIKSAGTWHVPQSTSQLPATHWPRHLMQLQTCSQVAPQQEMVPF